MIDVINPQLDSFYADYWAEYLPFALENWEWIVKAGCYAPRWYQAPTNALQTMTVGAYNAFALQIPAGSLIMAIYHTRQEGVSGEFTAQVTDTALGHQWFGQPVPDTLFLKVPNTSGRNGYVLTKPYPVITPGNFLVERWCTVAGICELLFAVAEPQEVSQQENQQ